MDLKNLLEDEDEVSDFNLELKQFFENVLPKLYSYSLDEVPVPILQTIAQQLHRTLYMDRDWQAIVYDMGVKDNKEIGNLDSYSKVCKELPILLALQGPLLHNRSYGHIIKGLLMRKRFDVLKDLKDFTESKLIVPETDDKSPAASSIEFNMDIPSRNVDFYDCTEKEPSLCEELLVKNFSHVEPVPESKLVVRLPNSFISVFIPHTHSDKETAKRLSAELQEQGIVVKLLSEVEHLLALNPTRALSAILREVDFISPILSESYLQQIYPSLSKRKTQEAASNCYVFNQIHSELFWDDYMNFRIRPVLVPELKRELLNSYPSVLNDSSFRLWAEVEKLANNLKLTKPILDRFKS